MTSVKTEKARRPKCLSLRAVGGRDADSQEEQRARPSMRSIADFIAVKMNGNWGDLTSANLDEISMWK